jgi:hypothetical protein
MREVSQISSNDSAGDRMTQALPAAERTSPWALSQLSWPEGPEREHSREGWCFSKATRSKAWPATATGRRWVTRTAAWKSASALGLQAMPTKRAASSFVAAVRKGSNSEPSS